MQATQIKDTVHISDVVGRYIELKRNGANYTSLCPFHNEKSPSLTVNDARGIFKCFGCGASGDVIDFVMQIEQTDFKRAIAIINGGEVPNSGTPPAPKPTTPIFTIPESRLLNAYNNDYTKATLYEFFTGLFPDHISTVNKVFEEYRVMSGADGLNIFPNVDINGSIRQVKELTADPLTGKRSHENNPRINGIAFLSAAEKESYQLRQCFFGAHLINKYPNRDLVACESEKTAIGMTIYGMITEPGDCDLWLATGGKNGVRMNDLKAIQPLKNRKVFLMPDNDAADDWRAYIEPIKQIAADCFYIDSIATRENAKEKAKFDIWDYTLEQLQAVNRSISAPATVTEAAVLQRVTAPAITGTAPQASALNKPTDEVAELEAFFASAIYTRSKYRLNEWITIIDPQRFVGCALARLKENNGDLFAGSLNDLKAFQQILN